MGGAEGGQRTLAAALLRAGSNLAGTGWCQSRLILSQLPAQARKGPYLWGQEGLLGVGGVQRWG